MSRLWKDILVPLAIAGCVAAQTVGVEVHRAHRLHLLLQGPDTTQLAQQPIDSLPALPPKDTLPPQKDSLSEEEEFDLFAGVQKDTVPRIFARDTMKVPDSLRYTNPFLHQWYIAVKDSFTHRLVVDSLKAAGDSLIWPQVDSLYLADSTAVATERFQKWYAGLSKSERKRYDYEQKLPAIMHRLDSIQQRKDSLKQRRDSIIQNTPRILETPFLPDSMHYKRLITWRHDQHFNRIETFQWDTTANTRFYDYPFMREDVGASWLGMPGSPVQHFNFFLRDRNNSATFFEPLETWTYTPERLTQFNTKTPYTELEYYGNLLTSSDLWANSYRLFTTQNILPALNITLEMRYSGGAGTLQREKTDNRNYLVSGNYLGKKYLAHFGFISDRVERQENGGVLETKWIRDTTVESREISIQLANAASRTTKRTVFLDQSYRIPFDFIEKLRHRGDSTWKPADTLNTNITTGFIGTSTEFTAYSRRYTDKTSTELSNFYNGQFNINPAESNDSLRHMRLENKVFVRLQPWKEDFILSKVEGGIGHRWQQFYLQRPEEVLFRKGYGNVNWHSVYAYAGVEGSFKRYLNWDAWAQYTFAGAQVNDFGVNAHAAVSFYPFRRTPDSPITLDARFETSLKNPDFYQQQFYSNHYRWDNQFGKTSTTKVHASLDIPKWKLKAQAGYALLANKVYYDTLGIARQHTADPVSVLTAGLSHHLKLGPVHLENSALFQLSSNQDVLPLPMLALNARWYVQFNIVNAQTLQLQLGINARYNTLWYAPSYNPVAGVFTNQKEEQYGNNLVFDPFINMQWKKCCIFLKIENVGRGWPMESRDYFTAHHYIQTHPIFKFGISWPFYPRLGKMKTLSERAGAGMGGGKGGGGGLGGLKGGLKGAISGGGR